MENKNILSDEELMQVTGRHTAKSKLVTAIVKDEDVLNEMKLPDFNLNTLPEIVTGPTSLE